MTVCKWCKKTVTRKCQQCAKVFTPKTCRQVFCSGFCRLLAFRKRKRPGGQKEEG